MKYTHTSNCASFLPALCYRTIVTVQAPTICYRAMAPFCQPAMCYRAIRNCAGARHVTEAETETENTALLNDKDIELCRSAQILDSLFFLLASHCFDIRIASIARFR